MKIGQKLKSIIGTVAPKLGMAAGGPLGALVGNMVGKALGVDSEEAALKMIESDPEALTKLKAIDADFDKRMAELGVDIERIHAEDRASARSREVAVKDRTPMILAFVLAVGFFGTLAYMLRFGLPLEGRDVIMVMIGSLGTAWIATVNYYFGSSSGSKSKTDLLARNGN